MFQNLIVNIFIERILMFFDNYELLIKYICDKNNEKEIYIWVYLCMAIIWAYY